MNKLIMTSRKPRVLTSADSEVFAFTPCQEDREKQIVGGKTDPERFKEILENSNLNPEAENPEYEIQMEEETEGYLKGQILHRNCQRAMDIEHLEIKKYVINAHDITGPGCSR